MRSCWNTGSKTYSGRQTHKDALTITLKGMAKMAEDQPMAAEEKKRDLYLRQKQLLDTFLEHGAISRAQYEKSLGDLTEKMGMDRIGEHEA